MPPADDCPDSVFVEDTVVMYGDRAVITRPGADERKPETAATADVLRGLGYDVVEIEAPGTLDGGDVLKHGGTVWVGLGGRTNQAGVDQLAAYLEPYGARVVGVPVEKVLHLKSAVTALPDGTVIGYPPLVDDQDVWPSFLAVPEEAGSHVVLLGDDLVLMSTTRAAHPRPARGARAARGRGRPHGVREARGLRDLPVGAAAPHALTTQSVGEGAELVAVGIGQHGPARPPSPFARSTVAPWATSASRSSVVTSMWRRFFTVLGSGTPAQSKDSHGQAGICSIHEKPRSSWSTATPPTTSAHQAAMSWLASAPSGAVPAQLVGSRGPIGSSRTKTQTSWPSGSASVVQRSCS